MDWQQVTALALVVLVAGGWSWARWRRRGASGCAGGCCGASARRWGTGQPAGEKESGRPLA